MQLSLLPVLKRHTLAMHIAKVFVLMFALTSPVALAMEPHDAGHTERVELQKIIINANSTIDSISAAQEDDEDASEQPINDPWESFNRSVYRFNTKADNYVIRPIAVSYDRITPKPVQRSVSNFFANLKSPTILINELLQGRPSDSLETFSRFAINTTVGVVGLFDPATSLGLQRHSEDFGQTLAVWGWENSNYVVLPLLGPLTMRDVLGFIGDTPTNPMNYADGGSMAALQSLEITDMRTQMLSMDDLRATAIDEYAMVRHAWLQGRNQEIREGQGLQSQAGTNVFQRLFQ